MTEKGIKALESLNEIRLEDSERKQVIDLFAFLENEEVIMKEYDTENTETMVHILPMNNILRKDNHQQNFSRESLLDGSPEHTDDSWQVPRLVK